MTVRVYRVQTWSPERSKFTAQRGVKMIVHGQSGLRRSLRLLRDMGYEARKGDSAVLVERIR